MSQVTDDPAIRTVSAPTLAAAVTRGLLTNEQVQALCDLEIELAPSVREPQDDEKLRFITGFGDIFVTIGIVLFLGALSYYALESVGTLGMSVVVAAAAWALAEFFTRTRRMALPSIVLLVVYAAAVFGAAFLAIAAGGAPPPDMPTAMEDNPLTVVGAALITVAAAALHYWRFRVPITIAAGVAALVAAVLGLLIAAAPKLVEQALTPIILVCGLAVFALAMRFDMSDPQRLTRRTDIAFWLHMLAAPMIVHPLVRGFLTDPGDVRTSSAWSILLVFALLALVAVLIDRRAVLVSGLSYAGIAFGTLVGASGLVEGVVPLTMLALGAIVLLLSAGWHRLRGLFLSLLPPALARRLPGSHLRAFQN